MDKKNFNNALNQMLNEVIDFRRRELQKLMIEAKKIILSEAAMLRLKMEVIMRGSTLEPIYAEIESILGGEPHTLIMKLALNDIQTLASRSRRNELMQMEVENAIKKACHNFLGHATNEINRKIQNRPELKDSMLKVIQDECARWSGPDMGAMLEAIQLQYLGKLGINMISKKAAPPRI